MIFFFNPFPTPPPFFSLTLTVVRSQVIVSCPTIRICVMFISSLDILGLWILRRKIKKMFTLHFCHFHHITKVPLSAWFITVNVDHLAEVVFVRIFNCEVSSSSPHSHVVLFGMTSLLFSGKYINTWDFLHRRFDCSTFINLFSQLWVIIQLYFI